MWYSRRDAQAMLTACAGQHGIPVMEIVLARSSTLLIVALATIVVRRQDPRGNRKWLLLARGCCGFTGRNTPCEMTCWYL